jgi:hypothetical protein
VITSPRLAATAMTSTTSKPATGTGWGPDSYPAVRDEHGTLTRGGPTAQGDCCPQTCQDREDLDIACGAYSPFTCRDPVYSGVPIPCGFEDWVGDGSVGGTGRGGRRTEVADSILCGLDKVL